MTYDNQLLSAVLSLSLAFAGCAAMPEDGDPIGGDVYGDGGTSAEDADPWREDPSMEEDDTGAPSDPTPPRMVPRDPDPDPDPDPGPDPDPAPRPDPDPEPTPDPDPEPTCRRTTLACDRVDNDCDGVVDDVDECQARLGPGLAWLDRRGGMGGEEVSAMCGRGKVAVGYDIRTPFVVDVLGSRVVFLRFHCATFADVMEGRTVTTTLTDGAGHESSASLGTDMCEPGHVAIGFRGRAGGELDQLSLDCMAYDQLGNTVSHHVTPRRGGGGGDEFADRCPRGYVLKGATLRGGARVDQIRGRCREIDFPPE